MYIYIIIYQIIINEGLLNRWILTTKMYNEMEFKKIEKKNGNLGLYE